MKEMGRKILRVLLMIAMVIGLLPGISMTAKAEENDDPAWTISPVGSGYVEKSIESDKTYFHATPAKGYVFQKWTYYEQQQYRETTGKTFWYLTSQLEWISGLTACFGKAVTGITLDPTSASMDLGGEALTLTATFAPDDALVKTVTWASDNESVATVANGVVTAHAEGTAKITATAINDPDNPNDDVTSEACTVTVTAPVAVTDITLNPSEAQTINVGDNVSFTAIISPETATDKTVKWSVNGETVKLYTDESCTSEVSTEAIENLTVYAKGISAGSATVTVTSNSNNDKSASCDVTVNPVPVTGITLNKAKATMAANSTETLIASIEPSNATDKTVTWRSSDESVALVANGVVTAKSAGTATITATATNGTSDPSDDVTATCNVTVSESVEPYRLWVGGTQVNSANKSDILGDGTASFVRAEGEKPDTLTLNGANIKKGHRQQVSQPVTLGVYSESPAALNIVLSGTNRIGGVDSSISAGIFDESGPIIITGKGSLDIATNIIGIHCSNDVTISSGTVTVNNTDSSGSGISSSGKVSIGSATVKVNDTGQNGIGISATNGVTISSGSVVTAVGGSKAISGLVNNRIAGAGWTDTAGTEGETTIPAIQGEGEPQWLNNYKKVMFPVPTKYPLRVGGTQVTSANASDVFSDGKVSFTPATETTPATLTLNGYQCTTSTDHGIVYGVSGQTDGILKIVLNGSNSVKTDCYADGIAIDSGNLIITDDGSGGSIEIVSLKDTRDGIRVNGDLTIEGGTVTTKSNGNPSKGIYVVNGMMSVNGGSVISEGCYGIHAPAGLNISGGTVEAIGTGSAGVGVRSNQGNCTIGSNVTSFVASGALKAIDCSVRNAIAGMGWTNIEGTEGKKAIAVSTDGQDLSTYKKVQFLAQSIRYKAIGDNQEWEKGSVANLTITFKGEPDDTDTFIKWDEHVEIDGVFIAPDNYKASEGSLVIDLKPAYLETLSAGKHTMNVSFTDGSASAVFSVKAKTSGGGGSSTPEKKTDNVVTCQMAGYPANYAWNEAAKACQPGYIDANGVFRSTTKGSNVPNTYDKGVGGNVVSLLIATIFGIGAAYMLRKYR